MNKTDLIDAISVDAGISKLQAKEAIESLTENITNSLKKGEKVSLIGWGTWAINRREARDGRNPRTGESIKIKAKNVVSFKAGATLTESVN